MIPRIIVLGGCGNFGKRISEFLSKQPNIDLLIAGRSLEKANQHCEKFRAANCVAELKPVSLEYFLSYSILLTVVAPEFWLHPFGPLTKNIPILALLYLAYHNES